MSSKKGWDSYFLGVCTAISDKSPCLSRRVGAILVRDKSIVSTGYNGPAREYPHCGNVLDENKFVIANRTMCPRRERGYASGEGLVHCPAAHAEGNCVANAARIGASTVGTTLYMNTVVPCKDCAIILVNAGIREVVVLDLSFYHEMSRDILNYGGILLRRFDL